jgi:predicted nucleic acid-binding protein
MKDAGVVTPRSHVTEMVASSLGYGSYAALQTDQDVDHFLDDIEYVLCNLDILEFRINKGVVTAKEADGFIAALVLEHDGPAWHLNEDAFFDDIEARLEDYIDNHLFLSDEVSAAFADTNVAQYDVVDDLEFARPPPSELYGDSSSITITATARITGEHHPDSERPFAGDTVLVTVTDTYDRITPRSFTLANRTVTATKGDSYHDHDFGEN